MALIRGGQFDGHAKDAIVLDLGDLDRQGENIRALAREEAERILSEARAERERLLDGASEEGRKAGYEEGKRAGIEAGREEGTQRAIEEYRAALAEIERSWSEALAAFDETRSELLLDARRDVLRLASLIAEKVVKRAALLDESLVRDQFAAILAHVASPTRLRVRIHPDDRAVLERSMPTLAERFGSLENTEIVEDASLSRGSCVAVTGDGAEIDAGIESQIDRLVEQLLPENDGLRVEEGRERDAA